MKIIRFLNSKILSIILSMIAIGILYAMASIDTVHSFSVSIGFWGGCSLLMIIFLWIIPCWLLRQLISFFTKKKDSMKWAMSTNAIMLAFVLALGCLFILGLEAKHKADQQIDSLIDIVNGDYSKSIADHSSNKISEDTLTKVVEAYRIANQKNQLAVQKLTEEHDLLQDRMAKAFIPDQFTSVAKLNSIRLILMDFKKYLVKKELLYKNTQSDIVNELEKMDIKDDGFWKEYNAGKANTLKNHESLSMIENESLENLFSLLAIIEKNLNHFTVTDGVFTFEDPVAQEEYVKLKLKAQESQEKESEINAKIANQKEHFIQKLEKLK